uniref:Uncharacterized protein n=1 Tax=Rattus norvegicus TaxID=10116 RepID=A0ABK0LSS0_RAT
IYPGFHEFSSGIGSKHNVSPSN